jgi:hypothetical protein
MCNVLKTGYNNFATAMNNYKIAEDRFNRHNIICVPRPDACLYMHEQKSAKYNIMNEERQNLENAKRNYIQKVNEQINKFQNEGPDFVSSTAFIQRNLENMKTLEIDFMDAKDYLETVDIKNKIFAPEEVASAKAVANEIANATAALVDKVNVVFTLADQIYSDVVEPANNIYNIAIKNFNEASDDYTNCTNNFMAARFGDRCSFRLSEKQSKNNIMITEKQNLENAKMNYIQKVNEQINKFQNEGPDYVRSAAFIQRTLEYMENLGIDISSLKDKEVSLTAVAPKEVAAVKAASSKIAVIVADANKIANEIFDRLNFTFIDIKDGYSGDNAYKDKFDYIQKVNEQITKFQDSSISRNAFIKRTSELKKILEQKLPSSQDYVFNQK